MDETGRASGGLRRALERRLLDDMIRKVGGGRSGNWKVLVVDREALRILSTALQVNELVNERVTLVEMLDMRREPLSRTPAIYFVTPSVETIQLLAQESPSQYKEFHLFFTSRVPDFMMEDLRRNTPLLRRVKCLVELDVSFLALESRLFTLDRPGSSLPQLHAGSSKEALQEMSIVSERLTDVCKMVGRGMDWTVRSDATSSSSRTVASLLKEQLETGMIQAKNEPDIETSQQSADSAPTKATVLVLDRATDLMSPLVHDFTYQALAHDLLKLDYRKPGGAHYEVQDVSGTTSKGKSMQLDDEETDPVWNDIRSLIIIEAIQKAEEHYKDFRTTDAAFKIQGKEGVDMKDMSAAVRALPASQKRDDKNAMHIHATKECRKLYTELGLMELALAEQDLLVGRQSDGARVRPDEIIPRLTELVHDVKTPLAHRTRLLMLAIAVAEGAGLLGGEASLLQSSASFPGKLGRSGIERAPDLDQLHASSVKGLQKLLATARAGADAFEARHRPLGADGEDGVAGKLKSKLKDRKASKLHEKEGEARRRRHGLDDESEQPYDIARYNPPVRGVVMDLVDDELDDTMFPTTGSVSVSSIIANTQVGSGDSDAREDGGDKDVDQHLTRLGRVNIRAHSAAVSGFVKGIGARGGSGGSREISDDTDRFRMADQNHLYVVFFVGGVCYPEVRAIHEVCAKREANVIFGGSHVLTPKAFVDVLGAVVDPILRIRVLMPPLPIALAQTRAAHERTLKANAEKKARDSEIPGSTASSRITNNASNVQGDGAGADDDGVEVATPYAKPSLKKRLFGSKRK